MNPPLLEGEVHWLSSVVDDLTNDDLKLVYADWLEERGCERGAFLRQYVKASRSMKRRDFPIPCGISEEWLELIGFRLVEMVSQVGSPSIKNPLLRLARPTLLLIEGVGDIGQLTGEKWRIEEIPVGASKFGGQPDLPVRFRWPQGADCRATFNKSTAGIDRLAGFLGQISFAEIAGSQATRSLPQSGLLSFFAFQDIENDDPDTISARAFYFPDVAKLRPTQPPGLLTAGNQEMDTSRLQFEETLDLPTRFDGPWSEETKLSRKKEYDDLYAGLVDRNRSNFLGYAKSTSGCDPTPSKASRHLISIKNSDGCCLHIQIPQKELIALNFDAITLSWVDFD